MGIKVKDFKDVKPTLIQIHQVIKLNTNNKAVVKRNANLC